MKVCVLGSYDRSLITFRGPMIRAMQNRGHEVLACAPELSDEVRDTLQGWGVRCREVSLSRTGMNPIHDLRSVRELAQLFRAERPDRLFAYTVKPVVYGAMAARLAGVPGIYPMITGLGYAFLDGGGLRQRLVAAVVQRLYRQALTASTKVFFQNPDDLGEFEKRKLLRSNAETCLVNGSGVDVAHYAPEALPDEPVFLLIARLIADKGVREYVAAAKGVKARYPQARFQLAGWLDSNPSAISQEELDSWVNDGVIEYLGALDDVRPALREARVYVLPSYREGTPRTVLEAMSMGRPVITTDAPGCRETVSDGVNGFLIPIRDIEQLGEAMMQFIKMPQLADSQGAAGRALAEQKFDVNKVNQVLLDGMGL